MQSNGNMIFVGIKINTRLRELLDASTTAMKPFFESNNPAFLQILNFESDEYIGKVVENGTSLEILSNLLMNVKTMLKMICPTFTPTEGAIKVFAITQEPVRTFRT